MSAPSSPDRKPLLDEASFQKLLAAAYVLQQHQGQVRPSPAARRETPGEDEYATTLAEIVETQHQILMRRLDLDGAAEVIVEQVRRITGASGAAIGLLDHEHLVYRAVSGVAVSEMGSALPKQTAISSPALADGLVVRCTDIHSEFRIDGEIARRANVQSFIAVPIFDDERVAGALELVFPVINGFKEHDVRTCQLMAGLVTEALARAADDQWKRNLTAERDSMLQALEKLKPQLDRLARDAESLSAGAASDLIRDPAPEPPKKVNVSKPSSSRQMAEPNSIPKAEAINRCHKCGNQLGSQEVYCGSCGTARSERPQAEPANKWPKAFESSVDNVVEPPRSTATSASSRPSRRDPAAYLSSNLASDEVTLPSEVLALTKTDEVQAPETDLATELLNILPPDPDGELSPTPPRAPRTMAATPAATPGLEPGSYPWTSAANARAWLNSLAGPRAGSSVGSLLREHRGDVSLTGAIILVLLVIFWGISDHRTSSVNSKASTTIGSATNNVPANAPSSTASAAQSEQDTSPKKAAVRPVSSQPQLSLLDRALISLGLAEEPPPAPQYGGNPDTKVWLDVRTALYYCPGADLYGKTPKGRYATQHEAQRDQFEPASREICE